MKKTSTRTPKRRGDGVRRAPAPIGRAVRVTDRRLPPSFFEDRPPKAGHPPARRPSAGVRRRRHRPAQPGPAAVKVAAGGSKARAAAGLLIQHVTEERSRCRVTTSSHLSRPLGTVSSPVFTTTSACNAEPSCERRGYVLRAKGRKYEVAAHGLV